MKEQSKGSAADHVSRGDVKEGYSTVLTSENAPLQDLAVGRLRLDKKIGGYKAETGDNETLLHILVGQCTIECLGPQGKRKFERLGERPDVFSGLPTSLVLGPRMSLVDFGALQAERVRASLKRFAREVMPNFVESGSISAS